MILGRTLEVGKFRHSRLDNVEGLLDFLLGDDQRRCKADNVLVGGLGLKDEVSNQ